MLRIKEEHLKFIIMIREEIELAGVKIELVEGDDRCIIFCSKDDYEVGKETYKGLKVYMDILNEYYRLHDIIYEDKRAIDKYYSLQMRVVKEIMEEIGYKMSKKDMTNTDRYIVIRERAKIQCKDYYFRMIELMYNVLDICKIEYGEKKYWYTEDDKIESKKTIFRIE